MHRFQAPRPRFRARAAQIEEAMEGIARATQPRAPMNELALEALTWRDGLCVMQDEDAPRTTYVVEGWRIERAPAPPSYPRPLRWTATPIYHPDARPVELRTVADLLGVLEKINQHQRPEQPQPLAGWLH